MPDVLIFADTLRSPELRHEIPVPVFDPFLYGEADGTRHVLIHPIEAERLRDLPIEPHAAEEYGADELREQGVPEARIRLEVRARAASDWGIKDVVTPWSFPLELADFLRESGITVRADREFFTERRRFKNEHELAGIRRAQRAAEAGMAAARDVLRRGGPVTCEQLKEAIERAISERGCSLDFPIVSHGPQTAIGHELGSGAIEPGEPVVIDLGPQDRESGCFADMTRTLVVGDPPAELVEWHRLCLESLELSLQAVRGGAQDLDVFTASCEPFRREGQPTLLDKEPGVPLVEGFYHALGHGVGLDIHEPPVLAHTADHTLVAGEVLALEPGLYRPGFGGVRLEDLVLVMEDGCENLTDFPYDLEP